MKIPETTRSDPIHFKSQPGSRKIWIVLWPRFSGFQEACDILKVSPDQVRHHSPGKLNGLFIQHWPVAVCPSALVTCTVLLNPAGLSLPSLRCTSNSSNSRPIGNGTCFHPYAACTSASPAGTLICQPAGVHCSENFPPSSM